VPTTRWCKKYSVSPKTKGWDSNTFFVTFCSDRDEYYYFILKKYELLSLLIFSRSWVIDDHIQSDGKVHLSTPVDPLFLILPYVTKVSFWTIHISIIQVFMHTGISGISFKIITMKKYILKYAKMSIPLVLP
jgi:hypothetical protein